MWNISVVLEKCTEKCRDIHLDENEMIDGAEKQEVASLTTFNRTPN